MAIAAAERTIASKLQDGAVSTAGPRESTCTRCGGLMVNDFFMDLLNSTGELEFAAKRCVQCGEVVDPVIQRNRLLRDRSGSVPYAMTEERSSKECADRISK